MPRSLLLLLAGALAASAPAFAQLSAGRTGANPGDEIRLQLDSAAARERPLYLAAVVGGQILFFDELGVPRPYQPGTPTPARLRRAPAGSQTLQTLTAPEGWDTTVTFYSAFGRTPSATSDILREDGIDPGSLQALPLRITPVPGGPTYAAVCQECHGYDPADNTNRIQAGRDADTIARAIARDTGGMRALSHLSRTQIEAISYWIQSPRFDCH